MYRRKCRKSRKAVKEARGEELLKQDKAMEWVWEHGVGKMIKGGEAKDSLIQLRLRVRRFPSP